LPPARISIASCLVFLAALLPTTFGECFALESGNGDRGRWEVVWRYDETYGIRTEFDALREAGSVFPFRWRHWNDTRGNRLQFLDEIGAEADRVDLGPGETALASEDASAWIILSPDPAIRNSHIIHFFRKDSPDPLWDAYMGGDPILLAQDGSVLVLAARSENYDQWARRILDGGGRLQVIGGEAGEILGELPIYPTFARMGDDRHIVLLQDNELFVLNTNGRIAWKTDVPLDNLVEHEGLSNLATASDLVVVCGTGEQTNASGFFDSLHPPRREALLVFGASGRLLWEGEESPSEELRFTLTCALSSDGSTIATLRDTEREQVVTVYEAQTGDKLFAQRVRRRSGSRTLSLSPRGELICLTFGETRTGVSAWNRKGDVVFDGILPLRSNASTIHAGNLLASAQWMVRLTPDPPPTK
jgi:hypothetical protein